MELHSSGSEGRPQSQGSRSVARSRALVGSSRFPFAATGSEDHGVTTPRLNNVRLAKRA